MKQALFLAAIAMSCLVQGMSACSCVIAHPQADYCGKGFVIRGTVQGVRTVDNHFVYDVAVSTYYRVSPDVPMDQSLPVQEIRTSTSKELCGVMLQIGTEYLLTGGFYADHFAVNKCGWYKPFDTITPVQLRGLNGAYDCTCKIEDYPNAWQTDEQLPVVNDGNTCSMGGTSVPIYCMSKQGICVRGDGEKCTWDVVKDNSC